MCSFPAVDSTPPMPSRRDGVVRNSQHGQLAEPRGGALYQHMYRDPAQLTCTSSAILSLTQCITTPAAILSLHSTPRVCVRMCRVAHTVCLLHSRGGIGHLPGLIPFYFDSGVLSPLRDTFTLNGQHDFIEHHGYRCNIGRMFDLSGLMA
jgi:hypothetical protein